MSHSPINENHSLLSLNSFGIACTARYFTIVSNTSELKETIRYWKKKIPKKPILILGEGSNILFTKQTFEGLVVRNNILGIDILEENKKTVKVRVGAGENWNNFVLFTVNNNYGGLENLTFIPGSCGAAPIQNIGAYGVEVKDVIESVRIFDFNTYKIDDYTNLDCKFGYRNSIFKTELKNKVAVCSLTFKLSKTPSLNITYKDLAQYFEGKHHKNISIKNVSNAVREIRQRKLPNPKEIYNAGSFFKNPIIEKKQYEDLIKTFPKLPFYPTSDNTLVKVPAAWLIDKCGFKGKRLGDVGCHENQALVIVNYGNASGQDIKDFSVLIQKTVVKKFSIALETEVTFI